MLKKNTLHCLLFRELNVFFLEVAEYKNINFHIRFLENHVGTVNVPLEIEDHRK